MRRGERLAKLNALLLRVQTNSRERREELGLPIAPRLPTVPPPMEMFAERRLVPPPPPSADDWTSLLAGELVEPAEPHERAPRDEAEVELHREAGPSLSAMEQLPVRAEGEHHEPPTVERLAAIDGGAAREAVGASAAVAADAPEPSPESVLERAVRRATEGRLHELELFEEAAYELRERRSTLPPREDGAETPRLPDATVSSLDAGDVPGDDDRHHAADAGNPATATAPLAVTEAAVSEPSPPGPSASDSATVEPEAPRPPRTSEAEGAESRRSVPPRGRSSPVPGRAHGARRRSRVERTEETASLQPSLPVRRGWLWAIAAGGLLLAAIFGARRLLDAGASHAEPGASTVVRTPSGGTSSTPPLSTRSGFVGSPEPRPPIPAHDSALPPATALPPLARPKEMGLLWVDVDEPADVYVQGLKVGVSGRYVEVPCGLKNVRVARSAPPPPGHSFPLWLGEAKSVLVPCGGENRVKLRPD